MKIGKNPENQKFWKPKNPEKPEKITGQMSGKTLNSISDEIG